MAVTWSLSDIVYPSNNDIMTDIFDGLHTLITGLTHWQVETDDRANNAIIISPTGGDATDQRIIFAATGDGTGMASANCAYPYNALSSNSLRMKRIFGGYTHDSSGMVGYATGVFNDANPLNLPAGSENKWWKYFLMSNKWNEYGIDKMWAIESENTIAIFFAKADGTAYSGGIFGYCFRDAENNLAPGVFTSGHNVSGHGMTSDFQKEDTQHFMGGGTGSANPSATGWTGTETVRLNKLLGGLGEIPSHTSRNGTRVHLPMYYQEASDYYYGRLEQIRWGQDGTERMRITDNNGVVKSFSFSPSLSGTSDALTFDQE